MRTAEAAPAASAALAVGGDSAGIVAGGRPQGLLEGRLQGQEQGQQSRSQRQQKQQNGGQEQGRHSGVQTLERLQGQQHERQQQQQAQQEQQQAQQKHVIEWAADYLEGRRSKQQLQLPYVEDWDAYAAATEAAVGAMVEAFGVAAAAAQQEVDKPATVGESDGKRARAVAAAVQAGAAARLDSDPIFAAADAADRAGAANVLATAFLEKIVTAAKAAATSSRKNVNTSRKVVQANFYATALAAVESVLHTEAGLALVTAAMQTASVAGPAVAAVLTVGDEGAGTVAGGWPHGLLEGRWQGHDSPCLKEQVEGLLWAGLFSINNACDLLQRLSCIVGSATVAGCGLELGQRQCGYPTGDKVLLAAIRKAEEGLAGQSQLPPSAAAGGVPAAVAAGGIPAAAAGGRDQAAGCKPAGGDEAGGADAKTVAAAKAAEWADKVAAAACASAGRKTRLGAAAEGAGTCLSLMGYHATIAGLRQVASYAETIQETLQEGGCFRVMRSSDSCIPYYSLLEQQGPCFTLQAASHVAMVRRLDWDSRWVELCSDPTSWPTREPISAGLGRQQGSKVGDKSMGFLELLSSSGDVLHDVVMRLPQQLLVEGSVLGEVQRKVMGWRGIDLAGRTCGGGLSTEQHQQQGGGGNGGIEESYRDFAGLFLMLQSCLWGMPVISCCNNLSCRRIGGISELGQVYGSIVGGGFCQGCKVACYCSAQCQRRAAPFHKHACKPCESKQ